MSFSESNKPFLLVAGLAAVVAYAALILGRDVSSGLYAGLGVAVGLGVWAYFLYTRYIRLRRMRELRASWGEEARKKEEEKSTRHLFDESPHEQFCLDDRSWQDLNMDEIFARMNQTLTTPGQQVLYDVLRRPEFNAETLERRAEIIRFFQENQDQRELVQVVLDRLGKDEAGAFWLLREGTVLKENDYAFYRLFFGVAVLSLALIPIVPRLGAQLALATFIFNMITHYSAEKKTEGRFGSIKYLGKLVERAAHLTSIQGEPLAETWSEIKAAMPKVASLRRHARALGISMQGGDIFGILLQYVSIYFLAEARNYCKAVRIVKGHRKEVLAIYRAVGYVDAMQAVASWRDAKQNYCEPEFVDERASLKIAGLYHPLLKDPVTNDLDLQRKGVLITGSNMSGKSTFLRAVGINVLLAQTIFTCPAESYRGQFFKLLTSIGRSDNVIEGRSYYLEEARALQRIIDQVDDGITTLCIVDEIFRGTNSLERIAASHRVLEYLTGENCVVFAATHDLELTELLAGVVENHHFQEMVGDAGLSFDYVLKDGPSTTRNAVELLRFMGYPEQIVERSAQDVAAQLTD